MGKIVIAFAAALPLVTVQPAPTPEYPIAAVPLTAVLVTDTFWAPKLDINRRVTIPHILGENESTGRVDNFRKAAHAIDGPFKGHRYDDTDIYKIIEAASYTLAASPDPALDKKIDALIAIVAAAQEPDGYLYAARTADPQHPAPGAGPERWSWLHTSHELYSVTPPRAVARPDLRAEGPHHLRDHDRTACARLGARRSDARWVVPILTLE